MEKGNTNPTTWSPPTTTTNAGLNSSTIPKNVKVSSPSKPKMQFSELFTMPGLVPTTVLQLSSGKTNPTPSSPTTSLPIKAETTDLAHNSSLAFIPTQVLPATSGKTNPTTTTQAGLNTSTRPTDLAHNSSLAFIPTQAGNLIDGIAEKVLYGSGRSSFSVFEQLCREKDNKDIVWPNLDYMCSVEDDQPKSEKKDDDNVMV